jgi:hypothetical protein
MAKEKKQQKQVKTGQDIETLLRKGKVKHPPKRRTKSRSEFSRMTREWSKQTDPKLRALSQSIFFFGREGRS